MRILRIEDEKCLGPWATSITNVFTLMLDSPGNGMPTPDHDVDGWSDLTSTTRENYVCGVPDDDLFFEWFPADILEKLLALGFAVYEYIVDDRDVLFGSEQVVFVPTRHRAKTRMF
jgi:hypothetical protein